MAASSRSSSGGSSLPDPYADAWERVVEAVLESPGSLQAYVRRAIERGEDPPELAPLLAKVRAHAYRIVDRDVEGLGLDVVFEAVLAAALGSGELRRHAALKAIG
jgi:hypothetical protein